MYDFDFELTEKDFINFGKDIVSVPRIRNMNLLICLLIFLLIFILNCMTLNNKIEIIVISVVMLVLIPPFALILQGINLGKANYKANKKSSLIRKMHFDDSGLTIDTGKSTTNINWDGIIEVYNKKNTILLFQTGMLALILPKRVFSNEQESNEFFNFVKQHVNH